MRYYSPKLGSKADPHYNVRGMAWEVKSGRGPIIFDTSTLSEEGIKVMTPEGGWMKLNDTKLKALGIDFFHQTTEWMLQIMQTYGGIKADKQGFTGVPGLFVAGRARSISPGVYMGGWDTCITSTTGYIAGDNAGKDAATRKSIPLNKEKISKLLASDLTPLGAEGVTPKGVIRSLQRLMSPMDVCILKTEEGLTRSLGKLKQLKNEVIPHMAAEDPRQLVKLTEARAMTLVTEAYLKASLMRRESRAGHFRLDFPNRDPNLGPAWVEITNTPSGMKLNLQKVPLEKYPVQPYRYYMDNFNFPEAGKL